MKMKKALSLAILLYAAALWGQANGPAPQNQPPGQVPLLVGGQYNTTAAPIAPGNMTPLQLDAAGNLKVNLQAGSNTGLGTAATDSTAFTAGSSAFTPGGGVFNDLLSAVTPGVMATFRITAARALHSNLRDSFGNEYNSANPFPVTIASITSQFPLATTLPYTPQNPLPIGPSTQKFYVYPMGENLLEPEYVRTNPSLPLMVTAPAGQSIPVSIVAQVGGGSVGTTVSAIQSGVWTVGLSGGSNVGLSTGSNTVGKVDILGNSGAIVDAAPGSATPTNALQISGTDGANTVVPFVDPCQRAARTYGTINLTANTQIITGAAAKQTYICSLNIVVGAATNVALVEGTVTTCGTGTAGMAGGATAATGWNFASNGGLVIGNGQGWVFKTATLADNVCILVSGANQVSGSFSYVQFP